MLAGRAIDLEILTNPSRESATDRDARPNRTIIGSRSFRGKREKWAIPPRIPPVGAAKRRQITALSDEKARRSGGLVH
jgi:hypothetical protein